MNEYLHFRFVVRLQYYFSFRFAAASVQQDPNDASKFVIVPQPSTPNIQTVQVQQAANPVVSTISPSNQVNPPSLTYGVITLAVSSTGTGTGTRTRTMMDNRSCLGSV